jgi:hypothetical protein
VIIVPHHPIPADELARRICVAHHPFLHTVALVPCGAHLQAARNVYGLVTEDGTMTFDVVVEARAESGLSTLMVAMVGETEDGNAALIDEVASVEGALEE